MDDLKQLFASISHEVWAHWMKYLFSVSTLNPDGSVTIPVEKVKRWTRQMNTEYGDLSEKEKASDLEQADKYLNGVVRLYRSQQKL